MKYNYRVNRQIRAHSVRVVGENVENPGIYPVEEALRIARDMEQDLVEISPKADPDRKSVV